MDSFGNLDRREFIALSAMTTAFTLLPNPSHAAPISDSGLVSLQVSGDVQSGYSVTILYRVSLLHGIIKAESSRLYFKTANGVLKTGSITGKPLRERWSDTHHADRRDGAL